MSASSRPFCISAVLRNTVLAVRLTTESASADKCAIARSISSLSIHQLASRPWVGSQAQAECLQKGVVFRARLFLGRDKRSRKPCVCDHAIKGEEAGCEDERPENDTAGNRMNSLGQRNQTGNARDDHREQAHRYQDDEGNNDSPRAGILGRFHSLSSLVCIWHSRVQSKRGNSHRCFAKIDIVRAMESLALS